MKIRRPIVPIVAFTCLAVASCTLMVEYWLVARAHEYDYVPPTPVVTSVAMPEPLKADLIAPTVGDSDLDFSPDGRLLAAVDSKEQIGGQGTSRVYRIADRQSVANLGTGADCCAWSPDGTLLGIARTTPARLELWNTTTWKVSETIAVPDSDGEGTQGTVIFGGLCFDQMQNVFVVARVESPRPRQTRSHAFAWWNAPGGRSKVLEAVGSDPKSEAFSLSASCASGPTTVLAISYVCEQHAADRKDVPLEVFHIWQETGRRIIRRRDVLFLTHEAWVRISPDGKMLATLTGADGVNQSGLFGLGTKSMGSWSLPEPNQNALDTRQMRFQRIDFSGENRLAVFIEPGPGESYSPHVLDLPDDKGCSSPPIPSDYSTAVGLSPDGHRLAVSAPSKGILVYRLP